MTMQRKNFFLFQHELEDLVEILRRERAREQALAEIAYGPGSDAGRAQRELHTRKARRAGDLLELFSPLTTSPSPLALQASSDPAANIVPANFPPQIAETD